MTREELEAKIAALTKAAEGLNEPDRTFTLNDIAILEMQLAGMALADLADKLSAVTLPQISEMNRLISDAENATRDNAFRVQAFNTAFGLLKTVLGIVL